MPNKEGGYAPNYTPVAATDGTGGFIMDCDVIAGPNEQNELVPSMQRIEEDYGKGPENCSDDKAFFVYDAATDRYLCPLGQEMPYRETKKSEGKEVRIYACSSCAGCPLAGECLDPKAKRGRTVGRDGSEPARERMAAKMATEAGRQTYNQRMHIAETPFAIIKGILEVRRFLLRGLEKVRTEWRWVCTAYNLKKLIAAVAAVRRRERESGGPGGGMRPWGGRRVEKTSCGRRSTVGSGLSKGAVTNTGIKDSKNTVLFILYLLSSGKLNQQPASRQGLPFLPRIEKTD